MSMDFHTLLSFITRNHYCMKHSYHLGQIFAQTITTGLIQTNPTCKNFILRSYTKSLNPIKSILIYNYFITSNYIQPDHYSYPIVLNTCTRLFSIPKGKEIHAHIIKMGLISDVYVQNSLIHFYGSTGQANDARQLFDNMPERDVTSWNSLLAICNTNNSSSHSEGSLFLFKHMLYEGIQADSITMVILLTACAQVRGGGLVYGKLVHGYIIKRGILGNLNMDNALLSLYAKCGEMNIALKLYNEMVGSRDVMSHTILINGYVKIGLVELAHDIFNEITDKDTVLWNSMIHGYVNVNCPNEALELFERMENEEKVQPDETTLVSALAACASLTDLQYGRILHRFILQNNIRQDIYLQTALIDMYSKCGSLEDAMVTFFKMEKKDVFTWTTVIEALANYGQANEALRFFCQMEMQGIKPNEATFVSILTACKQSGLVQEGCYLFERMVRFYKIKPNIKHFGCLIDILSKAGVLDQAERLVTIVPVEERLITYKILLTACTTYSKINLGSKVVDEIIKLGFHSHTDTVYTLLSNFYSMAGQWDEVAETRKIMKTFYSRKKQGTSSIQVISDL